MNERPTDEMRDPSSRILLMLAGLGFFVSLAFGGCKPKAQSGATAQQSRGSVIQRIQGLWSTGCHPWGNAGGSRLLEFTISSKEISYFQYEYADARCQNPRGRASSTTVYVPFKTDDEAGSIIVVTQPRSASVKPGSTSERDRLQALGGCGSKEWASGEEKNISMTNCGELMLASAQNGIFGSFRVSPEGDLFLADLPLAFKRQRVLAKPGASLSLDSVKPRNKTVFLAEAFLAPEKGRKGGPEEIQFGFTPETFQVQQCPDQKPGKGPEACGDFSPNMRKACEYCAGGIDICQKGTRWDLRFAQAIATQLQTRPPGGVCKPPGSEVGVIDPTESHDQTRAGLEAEIAVLNNGQLDGVNPDTLPQSPPWLPQQQPPVQGDPAAPVQVSAGEEGMKKVKEIAATAAGYVPGMLCGTGPWALACAGATMVAAGYVTQGTGFVLDLLLPTKNADAARAQGQ
ncbi:MAG: hypothetical protein IOD12_16205 [Silvanigrellales bacterium]|nr:hypothetical protein [Silvanigrellales bacterium]